jgi:hypothetical protein
MMNTKYVCDECGSDNVIYITDASFDPNNNGELIEQRGDWDNLEWCNECRNACTHIDEKEYVPKEDEQ